MKPCALCQNYKKPMKAMRYIIRSTQYTGSWVKEVGMHCNIILIVPICSACRRKWFLLQMGMYLTIPVSLAAAFYLAIHNILNIALGLILVCFCLAGSLLVLTIKRQRIMSWLRIHDPEGWMIERTTS